MKALLAFRPLFQRRLGALALTLVLSLVTLGAGVGLLATSGWFITATALTTAGLAFNLFVPSAMVRMWSFIRILSRYGERLVGHNATLRLLSDLRGWLFAALFPRLPLPDRSLRHGDLVSRLTADVDALDTAFLVAVGPWLAALLVGGAMTVALALLLPAAALPYGLCMLASVVLVPVMQVAAGRRAGRANVEAAADLRMSVLDGLSGLADLRLLGALGRTQDHLAATGRRLAGGRLRLGGLSTLSAAAVQTLAALALLGTLLAGLEAHHAGRIDGPVMVALLLAVLASFEATTAIVRSVGKAVGAMAAAERLDALARLPLPIEEPAVPVAVPTGGAIALEGVHFCYGAAPVLTGVDLLVQPGERVAVTGPSGSGKSTLLKLLLRLADPQAGQLAIGGVPYPSMASAGIQAHMSLLSQDSPVFIDTIRNNLLIGRGDAGDDALWAALDKAQLGEFVRALPKGLDTMVGESGRTLSVGQVRRLCLARALLSEAPVLLLDEPTNALDEAAAEAFFATLAGAAAGRTVILVTHARIPDGAVDRIVTLRNGHLVEVD